jgi:TonB family protein
VARGDRSGRHVGTGGTGTGTGGGGPKTSTGTGPPRPVSVASLKRQPMPIGDTDYIDLGRDYPAEARRRGIEGAVRVRLVVDERGRVRSTSLVSSLGYGLDELALRRARDLRFEPAIDTNDQPVAAVVVWTFNFALPR